MANEKLGRRLVGVSLKMYFDLNQTRHYAEAIAEAGGKSERALNKAHENDTTVFVIPSLPSFSDPKVSNLIHYKQCLWLGAQDCHWEDRGAYTGEISPLMLEQIGCRIVELGHAERRRAPINETDEFVAKKTRAVVSNRMIPLICIGEKKRSNIASQAVGIAIEHCEAQIMAPLHALQESAGGIEAATAGVVFAYEPVWAIGASEPASADHVLAVIAALRQIATKNYKGDVRFLYGGSAGPGTWEALKKGCDGLFLGRFAHEVENFVRIVEGVASP